ncbi:MAG: hypothetical protein FWE89_03420 [Syntrophaceae bacterium]|nr:hypothetical protein [Syntrophaceae bacterium]
MKKKLPFAAGGNMMDSAGKRGLSEVFARRIEPRYGFCFLVVHFLTPAPLSGP